MRHIKFYIKIAGNALLRWLVLSVVGIVLSFIGIEVALKLIGNTDGMADDPAVMLGGWAGMIVGIMRCIQIDPWPTLLLFASIVSVYVYCLIALKVSLSFAFFQILENKIYPLLGAKVSGLLTAIIDRYPGLVRASENVLSLREKLIESAKGDSTLSRIQRKVISLGMKKCRLDDLDLRQPTPDLSALISSRVMQAIDEAFRPTYRLFMVAVAVHAVFFVIAFVFDRA